MSLRVNLLGPIRSQRIYGVTPYVRKKYRSLREGGISYHDARLMVIGACCMFPAALYDHEHAMYAKEYAQRAKPERASVPSPQEKQ